MPSFSRPQSGMPRQIVLKIVYYGPGLCGKTTNVNRIYAASTPTARGTFVKLGTRQDRTLFFDFLPLNLPPIHGMQTRLHLYTVPGQLFYATSRRLIMRGADGVVFVADSQQERFEANIISLDDLTENLERYDLDIASIPFVIQYNKRDLPSAMPVEDLREALNPWHVADFEAIAAASGAPGVFDTLREVVKRTLIKLKRNL